MVQTFWTPTNGDRSKNYQPKYPTQKKTHGENINAQKFPIRKKSPNTFEKLSHQFSERANLNSIISDLPVTFRLTSETFEKL